MQFTHHQIKRNTGMHHIKINVFTDTEINADNWLQRRDKASSALPDISTTTCIWYSLNNNRLVCSETLHQHGEHVVIFLHQNGERSEITTENRLIAANRHVVQSHNTNRPVSLVLCGMGVEARKHEWKQQSCFITPGQPPLYRLIIFVFISAFVQNSPRMMQMLQRIMQKVRRLK